MTSPSLYRAASQSTCTLFGLLIAAAAAHGVAPPQAVSVPQSVSVPPGGALSGKDLLAALRAGGYVILMRHASSPGEAPDAAHANADNARRERQLDEKGITTARIMGETLRRLKIPIGRVLSSPTYRALETVRVAQLGEAVTAPELGEGSGGMLPDKSGARASWLKATVAEPPPPRQNTIIVTHYPNIAELYPQGASNLAEGEALILHPDGRGAAPIVSRVKIDAWATLQ
jgi:phosphohistidine phosphatase SixA